MDHTERGGAALMADATWIAEYLWRYFEELQPQEFYRSIFPIGELASHSEKDKQGRYVGIAVELLPREDTEKRNARRYLLTDELDILDELLAKDNFIIVSPISYIGKRRTAAAARYIYAIAIDLDGISTQQQLVDLFHQIEIEYIPKPSYIVWSGKGIHLYYKLEKPIPCYQDNAKQLATLKHALTKKIWNKYITDNYKQPQYQSLFQGFRMCGGVTKSGSRARAFDIGPSVSIEYLNSFVKADAAAGKIKYKSELTKEEAKKKYPEWYKRKIEEKKPRGTWNIANGDTVYKWWLEKLQEEITEGHRYFSIMVLAVYAKKCGVSKEQLEADAFSLVEKLDELTTASDNHFTREDILAAMEMYQDSYYTFPIDSIEKLTAIHIERNKRNGRKQADHLKRARAVQAVDYPNGEWRNKGRPTKKEIVIEWRQMHPQGKKVDCIRDTQLSKSTVYRHWND